MAKYQPSLVLYSGGQNRTNAVLHRELVQMAKRKSRGPIRLTYIPFCTDGSTTYFMRSVRRYARFGVGEFCSLVADERHTSAQIREAFSADIIYLAGGNTFYFLKALRKQGLITHLKEFALSGGILAGLSAGAHILTPHIALAGAPGLDPDENDVGLKNLKGLGLVPFEILPHFESSRRHIKAVREYSTQSEYPIFACPNGTGIIIDQGVTRVLGKGIQLYCDGIQL
ncbi:Type 1 glutamine amidotransferase-like domain-containing protein [Bdellovibrionota bacterium FG-2]